MVAFDDQQSQKSDNNLGRIISLPMHRHGIMSDVFLTSLRYSNG